MKKDFEIICGIYKITSPSGRIYIGQSIDVYNRWFFGHVSYKLSVYDNNDTKLHNSFNKHGVENHKFEIIESCTEYKLNEREIYYISFYNSCHGEHSLNLTEGGGGCRGYVWSDKSKLKMSLSTSGEKNGMFNKKHKEETKKRWSEIRKNRKLSNEHKANMRIGKANQAPLTQEHCNNISKGKLGIPNGLKGHKQTSEHIKNTTLIRLKRGLIKKGIQPTIENLESLFFIRKFIKVFTNNVKQQQIGKIGPHSEERKAKAMKTRAETKELIRQERAMMIF